MSATTTSRAPRRAAPRSRSRGLTAWFHRTLPHDERVTVRDGELLVLIVCTLVTTVGLAGDISRHLLDPASLAKGNDFLSGWHLVLYGGVFSVGLWLGLGAIRRGPAYVRAAPATAIGFATLSVGAVCDAAWHKVFGTEAQVEALVSPPHLVVFAGLVFLLSSPVVILWKRPDRRLGFVPSAAVGVSIVSVVLVTSLFTGFLTPLVAGLSLGGTVEPVVGSSLDPYYQVRGLGIAIWTVTVVVAMSTVVLVRFRPVVGTMVVSFALIGVPALVGTHLQSASPIANLIGYRADGSQIFDTPAAVWPLMVGFVAAGLASEVVLVLLARPVLRRLGLALHGAAVGAALWSFVFVGLKLNHHLKWGASLGGGAITLSALVGAAVASLVAMPVPIAPEAVQVGEGELGVLSTPSSA
jgi:hypothetical protein